jgi:hypothetical protein
MNRFIIPCLAGLGLACAQSPAKAQEFKERVTKEFTVPNGAAASTLVIYNINGLINIEGTSGNQVALDVDKQITARDKETLEEGKRAFKLAFEQKGDTIIAYIVEPFDSRPNRDVGRRNNWRNGDDRRIHYEFTLDFTVKVPRQINLNVSTVNHGDVTVKDVAGAMRVRNVNGAIRLTNARGMTDAHTINGNVEANYLASPPEKSSYYTLNGDIRVSYPATLSVDLQFKTFQGEFFTDFPEAQMLPVQVVKNQEKKGDKTVYKLDKTTSIRIGTGGKAFQFETFNGNVYIKKQS